MSDTPTPAKHNHKWELLETKRGKTIWGISVLGFTIRNVVRGKHPDVLKYLCSCGQTKEVEDVRK